MQQGLKWVGLAAAVAAACSSTYPAGVTRQVAANPTALGARADLFRASLLRTRVSDLTGVLNSSVARQPDSDRFRLWEVAGTAHADAHLVGALADSIDCGVPINRGPMHLVAKAAFHALDMWLRKGTAPVIAPRLELTEDV
jgi:hypothetical protein